MGWESQLDDYLRAHRRVKWFFLLMGFAVLVIGAATTYLRLEELCFENFGYACEVTPLKLIYLTLHYVFWGIALAVLGIALERKLNLENSGIYFVFLTFLPLIYGLTKYVLARGFGLSFTPSYLVKFAFASAVLLAVYISGIILKWGLEEGAEVR